MPIQEYRCADCGESFEVLVMGKSTPHVECPKCASTTADRLIGLPGGVVETKPATNCRGDGPPCGAPWCGRKGADG